MRSARRGRVAWAIGILASVLLHTLLFLLWPDGAILVEGARAADASRLRDEPVRVIDLPTRTRRAIPVPARPVLALEMPEVTTVEPMPRGPSPSPTLHAPPPPARLPPVAEAGLRRAPTEGYVRPIALSILPDWRAPASLHGVEIMVRVHISAAGRATGLVELVPQTSDPGTNREIADWVRRLSYRPALENGEPVAAWAEITFVFCNARITATSPASPTGLADPCTRGS